MQQWCRNEVLGLHYQEYSAEFMAFMIAESFSKNGTTMKVRNSRLEEASDF